MIKNTIFVYMSWICIVAFACRFAFADDPPGVLINQVKARGQYIGSPSLTILSDGTYFAAHDLHTREPLKNEVFIFKSRDQGKSWQQVSVINDFIGPTIFHVDDKLYLIGAMKQWGNMVIRRSSDMGRTWTTPTDGSNGKLTDKRRYLSIANPLTISNGRIWKPCEEYLNGPYGASVVSAPVNSDLLNRANWSFSTPAILPLEFFGGPSNRFQGGSLVQGSDGTLYDILSVRSEGTRAAVLPVSRRGRQVKLDLDKAFIDFPCCGTQFMVQYDAESKRYWSVVNQSRLPYSFFNILLLVSSEDLRSWTTETVLLQHVDSQGHGFQRPHWKIEDDDIVAVTAMNWESGQAATKFVFNRFENFRQLTMQDSAPVLGEIKTSTHQAKSYDISGDNFSIKPFRQGQQFFANWMFKLRKVPPQFSGWRFTQVVAASRPNLTVKVKRDCELFLTTGMNQGVIDLTGWSWVEDSDYRYLDRDVAEMSVFKRSVKAGETIKVPIGSWTSGMLLLPPDE